MLITIFASQLKIQGSKNLIQLKYFYTLFDFLVPLFHIILLSDYTGINNIQQTSGIIQPLC
jgi:hypothetical protein